MRRDPYFDQFFPSLSHHLTRQIMRANSILLRADAALNEEDAEEIDDDEDDPRELFESPPPPLIAGREAERAAHVEGRPGDEHAAQFDERLEACHRVTRERLYSYLGFLSRAARTRRQEEPYPIFEVLPDPLGHLLGIRDRHFRELPFHLTTEFRDWLARQHEECFDASWGRMRLADDTHLFLTANIAEREPRRAPRDSFPVLRPKSFRGR